uniref:Cytochrome P450 CYP719A3 n=1 Tax=Asarum sieboldii TaxID=76098 RepID=A0AAU7PIV5_9MAGN
MENLNIWVAFLTTALAVFFEAFRRLQSRRKPAATLVGWPVGPRRLPIIGNLHQLAKGGDLVHRALANLARVHGRVMTIWLGSWTPMIVVSDSELVWEVLVGKSSDYASRALPSISKFINADFRSVATSDMGPHWHSLRRGLQNGPLGPANVAAQAHLQEGDVAALIQTLKKEATQSDDGVVWPFGPIRHTTIRLLARLCFGADFDDEEFVKAMDRVVEDTISITGHGRLVDAFAFARFLPSVRRTFQQTLHVKRKIEEVIRPHLSPSPPQNSFLDVLLSQNLPEEVTIFCIFEVFLLGVDSTASTTAWALAFLIHHQDVQEKLHREISDYHRKEGGKKIVKAEDVSKLQYLQAVVKETMRMKPIAPLAVPHKTTKDTKLNGRSVGKGTQVVVNIYSVHYDPKVWTEPERFSPERFLAGGVKQGKNEKLQDQSFIPFGGGMRTCAGMELGKLQVALAVANLVGAFRWAPAVASELPDMSEEMTFVLMMKNPLAARIMVHDE